MNDSIVERVQEAIHTTLGGRKIDPVGCIDALNELVGQGGAIRCNFASERSLHVECGGQCCEVVLDAARAKLRMLCARLGTLCNQSAGSPVSLYGGEGTVSSAGRPGQPLAVCFKNTASDHEFTIAFAEPGAPGNGSG